MRDNVVGHEIERKFLVDGDGWRELAGDGQPLIQGYIPSPSVQIRVRISAGGCWLTFKSGVAGLVRDEFEYDIPRPDGEELLKRFSDGQVVEKTRYGVCFGDKTWEVDVFHGTNEGLVVAEIELDDESEDPALPPWVGKEITGDERFGNSNLAVRPWNSWELHDLPR